MREKLEVAVHGERSQILQRRKESEEKKQAKRNKVNENLERKRRFKEAMAADPGTLPGGDT